MESFQSLTSKLNHISFVSSRIDDIQGMMTSDESDFAATFGKVRKEEFRAGRVLARKLLSQLGYSKISLLADENRCPQWPEGIVGSIAHTFDYCMVAVTQSQYYKSIGIDLEIVERVKPQLWSRICTDNEMKWIQSQDSHTENELAALIFSTKEAFYKCQYILTHQFLNFKDVEISIDLNQSEFNIHIIKEIDYKSDARQFNGKYLFGDKYISTLCLFKDQD